MAQQTGTTAVGLELGSEDGLDATIGFDGERSRDPRSGRDRNATIWIVRASPATRSHSPSSSRQTSRSRTTASPSEPAMW
jgi:hypothetical protein